MLFSLFLGLALKNLLYFFYASELSSSSRVGSSLWQAIFSGVQVGNSFSSFWGGLLLIAALSAFVAYSSWQYALIREKTFLTFSVAWLLLCSQSQLQFFSAPLLSSTLFLLAVYLSLHLYQNEKAQWGLFNVACLAAFSSLISIQILPYVVLLFIGLIYNRIFSFRNILSLLLGLIFVYWLAFMACLGFGQFHLFVAYWQQLNSPILLHFLQFTHIEWLFSGIYLLLFFIVSLNFHFNLYKDKIRVRWQLNFLLFVSFVLFLSYCFACWGNQFLSLLIIGTFVLPLSHFFALEYSKFKAVIFFLLLIAYLYIGFVQIFELS